MSETHDASLLGLPVELLQTVIGHLDGYGVRAARLACKTLAHAGSEHLMHELHLIYKLDRFERLEEVVKHPVVARNITSLYYQADRLDIYPTKEAWEKERHPYRSRVERDRIINERPLNPTMLVDKGKYSDEELEAAYQAYLRHVEEQARVARENLDVRYLTCLFRGCPNLNSLTFSIEHGPKGQDSDMIGLAFADAQVQLFGDSPFAEAGKTQLLNACRALKSADKILRELTAGEIGYKALSVSPEELALLKDTVRPLQMLRLWIAFPPEDERAGETVDEVIGGLFGDDVGDDEDLDDDEAPSDWEDHLSSDDEEDELETAMATLSNPAVHDLISAASELRHLKLILPEGDSHEPIAAFSNVIGSTTWQHLQYFGISSVSATEDDVVAFFLRHKDTLRTISLSYIVLTIGDWRSIFERIAGRFPNLKKVKLNGNLLSGSDHEESYEFDIPGAELYGCMPFRNALARFIIHGRGSYPDEAHCPPPVKWEDEHDCESSMSSVSYESDEFDWHLS